MRDLRMHTFPYTRIRNAVWCARCFPLFSSCISSKPLVYWVFCTHSPRYTYYIERVLLYIRFSCLVVCSDATHDNMSVWRTNHSYSLLQFLCAFKCNAHQHACIENTNHTCLCKLVFDRTVKPNIHFSNSSVRSDATHSNEMYREDESFILVWVCSDSYSHALMHIASLCVTGTQVKVLLFSQLLLMYWPNTPHNVCAIENTKLSVYCSRSLSVSHHTILKQREAVYMTHSTQLRRYAANDCTVFLWIFLFPLS